MFRPIFSGYVSFREGISKADLIVLVLVVAVGGGVVVSVVAAGGHLHRRFPQFLVKITLKCSFAPAKRYGSLTKMSIPEHDWVDPGNDRIVNIKFAGGTGNFHKKTLKSYCKSSESFARLKCGKQRPVVFLGLFICYMFQTCS